MNLSRKLIKNSIKSTKAIHLRLKIVNIYQSYILKNKNENFSLFNFIP